MGPKQKKATRKFERKHLAGAIAKRKTDKVAANRRREKEMRLAASGMDGEGGDGEEGEDGEEEGEEGAGAAPAGGKKRLEDMSIDEFLNAGKDYAEGDGGDDDEEGAGDDSDEEDESAEEADEDAEEWPEGEMGSDDDDNSDADEEDDEDAAAADAGAGLKVRKHRLNR
jgi:nucleolar complex protein 2